MPKPFDATLKELIEAFPEDWLNRLGIPVTGPVEVLSPELSTVTAAADALLRVGDTVLHIDAESGPDPDLPTRMLLYNVLIHRQTGLPVHSVAVLLRSNANPGGLSDTVRYAVRPPYGLEFRFEVIRLWEQESADMDGRGLGVLPLLVLCKPPRGQTRKEWVVWALEGIADRVTKEASKNEATLLMTSAVVFAGMYLDRDEIRNVIRRFPAMIQSSAFEVLEEMGAIKQARKFLLRQGEAKFGKPTDEQRHKLDAIEDLARLDRLGLRLLKVRSWDALLRGR